MIHLLMLWCLCGSALIAVDANGDGEDDEEPSATSATRAGVIGGRTAIERCTTYIDWLSHSAPTRADFPKDAMAVYAAHLLRGVEEERTLAAIRHMMAVTAKGPIDPFNRHAVVHGFAVCPERYPQEVVDLFVREVSRQDHSRDIGVSLNYQLMSDGAAFIAAERWPQLTDRGGNDAARIRDLTKKRLLSAYAVTMRRNAQEYEAPLYYGTDIMPTRMLAEFAADAQVKQVATVALAGMLAHVGAHWHRGYFITTSGRAKYWGSNNLSPDNPGATTAMAFLLYGGDRPASLAHLPQGFWLAHPGSAVPLDWLPAWHATLPSERVVTGSVLRGDKGFTVRKQAWMLGGYGLASQRSDGTGPGSYLYKECRSHLLRWVSDRSPSTFLVFQDNRRRPHEKIANAFCYGENPYSQLLQDRGTLIAVYNVPDSYGLADLHVPFTTRGAIVRRLERGGWVCCHGGSVLFAFRSLTPWTWGKPIPKEGVDILHASGLRGGWILETAAPAAFAREGDDPEAVLGRFADALAARTTIDDRTAGERPVLAFTNLAGRRLELTWHPPGEAYTDQCTIDGTVVPYARQPLIETTGLHQAADGPMTVFLPGDATRVLDFTTWTISEGKVRR